MHCGANTYQASSDNAVASDQLCAMMGDNAPAVSLPVADRAYTVPSALTATSRAARPGTSAMLICQLKPMGASTSDNPCPSMPAKLYSIAGRVASAGAPG